MTEDREQYFGPKISPDMWLESVGRDRQSRDGAAGVLLDELRAPIRSDWRGPAIEDMPIYYGKFDNRVIELTQYFVI
jgi:hypothetical protein